MAEQMRFFVRLDDRPDSENFGKAQSLHRFQVTDSTVISEWYNPDTGEWVDDPLMIAFTGIGGDEDFQEIDQETANEVFQFFGGEGNLVGRQEAYISKLGIVRGGKGSGHFDHEGRPGKVGGSAPAGSGKRVGITSARPGREGEKIVFEDMRGFEKELKTISGVSNVMVEAGQGGWEGGSEPTWVVAYRGNGDALRLIARTGQEFDQDAVLLYESCKEDECSVSTSWVYDSVLSPNQRDDIEKMLVGVGVGGWTWYNDGQNTALRAVAVPQWGGDRSAHLASSNRLNELFSGQGLGFERSDEDVLVTILEREGENSYASFLENN